MGIHTKETDRKCEKCQLVIKINYIKNTEIDDNHFSCGCESEFYHFAPWHKPIKLDADE